MQSFAWYVSRLRSMSVPEIGWRVRSAWARAVERRALRRGVSPLRLEDVVAGAGRDVTAAGVARPGGEASGTGGAVAGVGPERVGLFRADVFPEQ